MRQQELAAKWANGDTVGSASAFSVAGDAAYSYGVCIAVVDRESKTARVNSDHYSQTTSTHQGNTVRALIDAGYEIVEVDPQVHRPSVRALEDGAETAPRRRWDDQGYPIR